MSEKQNLSAKPQPPLPSDCCGNGCKNCVWDIYEEEIKIWENEIKASQLESGDITKCKELSPTHYVDIPILEIIDQPSPDTKLYIFLNTAKSKFYPGQHLVLRCRANENSGWISRQYTPISWEPLQSFSLLIKTYPEGVASSYIRNWKVGDTVQWRGPCGEPILYSPTMYRRMLLLAAGTGVTPMISLMRRVTDCEDDYTHVRLLIGARTLAAVPLRLTDLRDLARFWNISISFCLSQEDQCSCNRGYGEELHFGRIDRNKVEVELASLNGGKILIVVCGPQGFCKDVTNYLEICGRPRDSILVL